MGGSCFGRWVKRAAAGFALVTRPVSCKLDPIVSGFISYRFRSHQLAPLFATLALTVALCGCSAAPIIGFHAADYRQTEATAGDSQLLLNILRAKDDLPIHFADLAIIHGSIQLTAGSSATIPFANLAGSMTPSSLSPTLGAQTQPTFDVSTLDTQDFTRGMLTPVDPNIIKQLFDQGIDPRIIMILFFSELRDLKGHVFLNNTACDPNGGLHPERGCYYQFYDYLTQIDALFTAKKGQLHANVYVTLRPSGGPLSGDWTLKDTLDPLSKIDAAKYKMIGKTLYTISPPRLAICYSEDTRRQTTGRNASFYPLVEAKTAASVEACNKDEVKIGQETPKPAGFTPRSTYQIIQYLGQVLRYQQEKAEIEGNRCLTLNPEKDQRRCDTGNVLFQVNAPVGTPVVATRYADDWYALYDRKCNRNTQQPCDYSLQVLAILELLLNYNKAAKDIISTPRVQLVP